MRRLWCTKCGTNIRVHEEPREFIDPARFVCGECLQPTGQLALEEREETHSYDPEKAAIPF